jgi:alkylmercury lyase-like protein
MHDKKLTRKYILDHFFEYTTAPPLEEVMQRFGLSRKEAFSSFRDLESDHDIVLVPGTQRILMANPFSAISTPFRVIIGTRRYFANCAWDTVALHVMLKTEARIVAFCHHCAELIEISVVGGEVRSSKPPSPLIFLSVPVAGWYDDLINTCSNNMVYFASKSHLDHWLAENPRVKGEALTVEDMVKVCRPLALGRMSLDWQRPSKEELMAHWDSLGMKGKFWNF